MCVCVCVEGGGGGGRVGSGTRKAVKLIEAVHLRKYDQWCEIIVYA